MSNISRRKMELLLERTVDVTYATLQLSDEEL